MTASLEERATEEQGVGLWMPAKSDRFSLNELIEPPPAMTFVLYPYLPAGCPAVLTGAGGTSKTGTVVMLSIAICAGLDLFGEPVEQGRVLIVSAEDRRAILHRHVWANTRSLADVQRKLVSENLYAKDTVGSGFKLTRHIEGQTVTAVEIGQLVEYADEIGDVRLIVLDTLSRLNGAEESNEDLARFVESMERISVATGAATLALHHSGKAQMRGDANDQYAGRGGSALSDNCRSALHLAAITADTQGAPTNARELIADGRLLRLAHVKSNYATKAPERYLERVQTPYAAALREFNPEFGRSDAGDAWRRLEGWMATQKEVPYPTKATLEALGKTYGSRTEIRHALQWAADRGHVAEVPHPDPKGGRKTFLKLVKQEDEADAYRRATSGE